MGNRNSTTTATNECTFMVNQKIFSVHSITLFASRIDCIFMMWLIFLLYTLLSKVNLLKPTNIALCNIITPDADEGVDEPNKFTSCQSKQIIFNIRE